MNIQCALKQAASEALASGDISQETHDAVATFADGTSARRMRAIELIATHRSGQAAGSIDWVSMIAALKDLLPLILQIIALFGKK